MTQVYSALPSRSVRIFGIAVLTTVWSRAPRNSASMTAPRISNFWRRSSPSAGSSDRFGVGPRTSAGMLSIRRGTFAYWG